METFVRYKLLNFGNGLIKPPEVYDGGVVWNKSSSLKDTEFLGKIKRSIGSTMPDGVLSILTADDVLHKESCDKADALKRMKQDKYKTECDPMFFQALREKELGDSTKWNDYVNRCEMIKNMQLEDFS
jgi:hypothetical protein